MASNVASKKYYTTSAAYAGADNVKLTNGVLGGIAQDGANEIFYKSTNSPVTVIVDLEKQYKLSYVRFNYDVWTAGTTYAPHQLDVYGSNDNVSYTSSLGTFVVTTDWGEVSGQQWSNNLTVSGNYRYVKMVWVNSAHPQFFLGEVEVYADNVPVTSTFLKDREPNRADFNLVSG